MTDRELMQQALEALVYMTKGTIHGGNDLTKAAITALRERLAQPEQEPVQDEMTEARRIASEYALPDSDIDAGNLYWALHVCLRNIDTAPQPRQWVDLTNADIHNADPNPHNMFDAERLEFGRRLEAVMREKNA